LILVFLVLALFLDLRLAFWVAVGIPITFLGTFALMPALGLTVNMVTLFAFIVTLGLVVDDAIVVGEEAYEQNQLGKPWSEAAVAGAKRMAIPVTFAILTTFAAFAPLLMVPGFMGKIFGLIPAIAITVLFFSLIESFFILPAHLSHDGGFFKLGLFRPVHRARELVAAALQRFIYKGFAPVLQTVLEYRRLALGVSIAVFAMSVGLVARGVVPFSFFPKLEGDVITASARLPYGAPLSDTAQVRAAFEASLAEIAAEYGAENIKGTFTRLGETSGGSGPGATGPQTGSHLVSVEVNLVPSGEREFSSNEFAAAWAAATPEQILPETYSFNGSSGPGAGAAVDVVVSHPDEAVLAEASEEVADLLRTYKELTDIENGYAAGKIQLDYTPLGQAQNLGLSTQAIGAQVRGGFYGVEALREQRGRNEVKVMVRLPEDQRDSQADLGMLRIRTPGGGHVPLEYVAEAERGSAPTSIKREDGARIVNVRAELAAGVRSSTEVVTSLSEVEFARLEAKYPGLELGFSGSQRNQAEVFGSLGPNYLMALFAIYALLAIPFRSYIQPAIIMMAIPFGFVGAVLGHLLMGYELSIISMFGLVALTGVVVNDSLVLIDAANRRREAGAPAAEAIVFGATRRFRPILLTSLTTFFGLAPMIAEQSVQARFLIPMAISLGFGVLFATVIVLLLIPALYMLVEDARAWLQRMWELVRGLARPAREPAAQAMVEAAPE
jgi:multidrug efflux pump subunit AcrB